MSRTIRRKNFKISQWLLSEREYRKDANGHWSHVTILYEGKDLQRILARYHSDATRKDRMELWFESRRVQHKIHRARARQQLDCYKRNPEIEIMIHTNPHLNFWC